MAPYPNLSLYIFFFFLYLCEFSQKFIFLQQIKMTQRFFLCLHRGRYFRIALRKFVLWLLRRINIRSEVKSRYKRWSNDQLFILYLWDRVPVAVVVELVVAGVGEVDPEPGTNAVEHLYTQTRDWVQLLSSCTLEVLARIQFSGLILFWIKDL